MKAKDSELKSNQGKQLAIEVDGVCYLRYPIKTHVISPADAIGAVVQKYALPFLKKNDTLVISERVVAITQGRSFFIRDIAPSWWAIVLSRFVGRHPGGIGLKSPYTMELAIGEAGLMKILIAAGVSALTKPFGIKGLFYSIVGADVNAIDGPCDYTLPPGNQSAKLGPRDPTGVALMLSKQFNVSVTIIDANDYGVRVLGASAGLHFRSLEKIFSDNPLGQAREQTPLAIVRVKY